MEKKIKLESALEEIPDGFEYLWFNSDKTRINVLRKENGQIIGFSKPFQKGVVSQIMKEENKFAIKACEYKFKAILFTMLGNKDYKQMRLKWDEVKEW